MAARSDAPAGWICPECGRQFGRRKQSHQCAPAMSLERYFATGPVLERAVFEPIAAHLATLGPLTIEALSVGIFFKRTRTFAELRPMRDRVRLGLLLSRTVAHPKIVKSLRMAGLRSAYFVDLREPADVDDQVQDWLTEAYLASPR